MTIAIWIQSKRKRLVGPRRAGPQTAIVIIFLSELKKGLSFIQRPESLLCNWKGKQSYQPYLGWQPCMPLTAYYICFNLWLYNDSRSFIISMEVSITKNPFEENGDQVIFKLYLPAERFKILISFTENSICTNKIVQSWNTFPLNKLRHFELYFLKLSVE